MNPIPGLQEHILLLTGFSNEKKLKFGEWISRRRNKAYKKGNSWLSHSHSFRTNTFCFWFSKCHFNHVYLETHKNFNEWHRAYRWIL